MWIGPSKKNEEKPLGFKWPSGPIKVFGVFFLVMIISYVSKTLMRNLIALKNKSKFGLLEDYPSTGK